MKKLIDANPHWIGLNNWASPAKFYIGISFECPCPACQKDACSACGRAYSPKRLAVTFWPPIDPEKLLGNLFNIPDNKGHRRASGETFDDLTLTPSIGFEGIGHWHGHLTNGELLP